MMQAGKYKARAVGPVIIGTSKSKGTPFVECYFKVTEGDLRGESVRWTSYFAPSTEERTLQSMEYCGWKGGDFTDFADRGLHGMGDEEVEIVVGEESYESDTGPKVAYRVEWVNKLGGYLNEESAMTGDALAAFSSRMSDLLAARKATGKSKAAKKDDGIPF